MKNSFDAFRTCAWRTVSYRAAEMAATRALVEAQHPHDALVISCQRLEAYGFGPCSCGAPEQVTGWRALSRLAAVAAGLESVVLGETQIMGQVRQAFATAEGPLRRTGDAAVAAARGLRSETRFTSHSGHLLDRALRLSTIPRRGQLLVLGAGTMGKLVAERAAELGFVVTVASRRRPEALPGDWVELGRVPGLGGFDVIAGCLGSGAGEIAPRALPPARLLIDLGTPRNFNAPSGPGVVTIADMLADEAGRPHAVARRKQLRTRLDEILTAHLDSAATDSRSAVGAFRASIEDVRRQEVARASRIHPDVSPEVFDAITKSLVDKLFHAPTARLRASQDGVFAAELAGLFGTKEGAPAR